MPYALLLATIAVLTPIAVGMVCLFARRDSRLAILVMSASALSLAAINLLMYLSELFRIVPSTSSELVYSPYDSIRALCSIIAIYLSIAAWVLSLQRAAHTGRLKWMTAVVVAAMISMVCYVIERAPFDYFTRSAYNVGIALLLVLGMFSVSVVTLTYALATRRDSALAAPMLMMYPPMAYPPMMYPPTYAPYGPPVSYAPPSPVVLPAPQPQPPTMTTPS